MDLTAVHFVAAATLVAAFIAALVSLVTLVNSKEQKTTEFRQAWINELRAEVANFEAQARYIAGAIQHAKRFDPLCFSTDSKAYDAYADNRHKIGTAYYLICLHFKPDDPQFTKLQGIMDEVLNALGRPDTLRFDPIATKLSAMTMEARRLFKNEWERVKLGEVPYKWTKRAAIALLTVLTVGIMFVAVAIQQGWPIFQKSPTSTSTVGK